MFTFNIALTGGFSVATIVFARVGLVSVALAGLCGVACALALLLVRIEQADRAQRQLERGDAAASAGVGDDDDEVGPTAGSAHAPEPVGALATVSRIADRREARAVADGRRTSPAPSPWPVRCEEVAAPVVLQPAVLTALGHVTRSVRPTTTTVGLLRGHEPHAHDPAVPPSLPAVVLAAMQAETAPLQQVIRAA